MTPFELQKSLAKEIELVTKGIILKNAKKEETSLKSYLQMLPIKQSSLKEAPYPFCIVHLESGNDGIDNQNLVRTLLLFGIIDDGLESQGHVTLLNIMQRIQERFIKNPILDKRYVISEQDGIGWYLQSEPLFPYYRAGMELTWQLPNIRRERNCYD